MPETISKPSLLSPVPGFLVLRVQGGPRNGQVVRLKSAKCTIGSGPSCTLRLRAKCVDPVHCLVLRGPQRTIVRRWSADTRLNGKSFDESALQAGDRLSIGRLNLEVVDTGQAETPAEIRLAQQKSLEDQLAAIEFRLRGWTSSRRSVTRGRPISRRGGRNGTPGKPRWPGSARTARRSCSICTDTNSMNREIASTPSDGNGKRPTPSGTPAGGRSGTVGCPAGGVRRGPASPGDAKDGMAGGSRPA